MDLADLSALMGEAIPSETGADIWVVLPPTGRADRASAGDLGRLGGPAHSVDLARSGGAALLAEARRLADGLGCYVHAVLPEAAAVAAQDAIAFGADQVHVTGDVAGFIAGQRPEFVLLPAGCEALAAALAETFGAGLITGAVDGVAIDPETRELLAAHPVYGGEYELGARVTSSVKMATVQTGGLPTPARDANRSGEVTEHAHDARASRVRDLGAVEFRPPDWRPLSKARVIVAVGRGVKDREGLALAAELADKLGAELAGDRSARDSGWIDAAHEVGVTAQEVAPELYVAVGILGDTIHNAAIAGARRVVAIHANPNAPIFAAADVAVAGEPKTILRELLR